MENAVNGNSIETASSKKDIVTRNKIIKSMEIYNLIIKLVSSQLSANTPTLMQSLFLRIFAVFELEYFKCLLKFFYVNVKLDSLHYVDMLIVY